MAKSIIRIKGSDSTDVVFHTLHDGEVGYIRYDQLQSGPQEGLNVNEYSMIIGDGTTSGGVPANETLFGTGLSYAMQASSKAMKEISYLEGNKWVPWLLFDTTSPFGGDAVSDCLIPDVINKTPSIHLGYGYAMFDGTDWRMKITEDAFRFQSFITPISYSESDPTSFGPQTGFAITTDITLNDIGDFPTSGREIQIKSARVYTVVDSSSTMDSTQQPEYLEVIGLESQLISHEDLKIPYASGFNFKMTDGTTEFSNGSFGTVIGYKVDTVEMIEGKTNPDLSIDNLYGFSVWNTIDTSLFVNNLYGYHIGTIDAPKICSGFYSTQIGGVDATAASGIRIGRIGADADAGTSHGDTSGIVGDFYGIFEKQVGWSYSSSDGASKSIGLYIHRVSGNGNDNLTTGDSILAGVYINEIKSDSTSATPAGMVVRSIVAPETEAYGYVATQYNVSESDMPSNYYGFRAENLDSYSNYDQSWVRGFSAKNIGVNKGQYCFAISVEDVGNINYSQVSAGSYIGSVSGYVSGGLLINNIVSNDSTIDGTDVLRAVGINVDDVHAGLDRSIGLVLKSIYSDLGDSYGLYIQDVYSYDNNNPDANVYGVYLNEMSDKYFKKYSMFYAGDIDAHSLYNTNTEIYGINLSNIGGKYATIAYGMQIDSIGSDFGVYDTGNAQKVRGIVINQLGNTDDATSVIGLKLGANDVVDSVPDDSGGIFIGDGSLHGILISGIYSTGSNTGLDNWNVNGISILNMNSLEENVCGLSIGDIVSSYENTNGRATAIKIGDVILDRTSVDHRAYFTMQSSAIYKESQMCQKDFDFIYIADIDREYEVITQSYWYFLPNVSIITAGNIGGTSNSAFGMHVQSIGYGSSTLLSSFLECGTIGSLITDTRENPSHYSAALKIDRIDNPVRAYGIYVNEMRTSGNDVYYNNSTFLHSNEIYSDGTSTGLYLGSIGYDATYGYSEDSYGINISRVDATGSNCYGVKLTNVINWNGSGSNNAYGLFVDTVRVNTNGSGIAYGAYIDMKTISAKRYSLYLKNGRVHLDLPTSSSGLADGDLYEDSGTVKVYHV